MRRVYRNMQHCVSRVVMLNAFNLHAIVGISIQDAATATMGISIVVTITATSSISIYVTATAIIVIANVGHFIATSSSTKITTRLLVPMLLVYPCPDVHQRRRPRRMRLCSAVRGQLRCRGYHKTAGMHRPTVNNNNSINCFR